MHPYNRGTLDPDLNHESLSDLGFQYDLTLPSAAGPPFIQVGGQRVGGRPDHGTAEHVSEYL